MSKTVGSGNSIGDWFLYIECEIAKTDKYRRVPLVSVRRATASGEILSTVVASREMAAQLRHAAKQIEEIIDGVEEPKCEEATP